MDPYSCGIVSEFVNGMFTLLFVGGMTSVVLYRRVGGACCCARISILFFFPDNMKNLKLGQAKVAVFRFIYTLYMSQGKRESFAEC